MKILLVNDDGIYSQGILTLAYELMKEHDVTLVAPQHQMSGMGHSISYYDHVNFIKLNILDGADCYAVSGTPADCVKVALNLILKDKPDIIVSGINKGFNLGTDVLYSGTLNAALEGSVQGIKAIAVSQEYDIEGFEFTSKLIAKNLKKFYSLLPYDAQTVFNINVPIDNEKRIKGIKFCRVGVKIYDENYQFDNNLGYRLKCIVGLSEKNTQEDDVILYEQKFITVSAVKNDWNDLESYQRLKDEVFEL